MAVTIFFSWQSDTAFNRKAIRIALRESANVLEQEKHDLVFNLDEATSRQVGSLHIPNAILDNITNSDIFVGDLSVLGEATISKKKLSNPNVLIELGYAISQLGWNRIIILFNKQAGSFNDLPFDIEKRSCLDFNVLKDDDKNGIGQLRTELITRIRDIVEANPDRPQNRVETLDRERANDLKQLKSILFNLSIPLLDEFFKDGHDRINGKMLNGIHLLESIMTSKSFYLNDKKLKKLLNEFYKGWQDIFQYALAHYSHFPESNSYISKLSEKGRKSSIKRIIQSDIIILEKSLNSLLKYIRSYYPELDI